jgi:hypothetical protein
LPDPTNPHRWRRITLLVLGLLVIEAGLMVVSRMAPAMSGLMQPVFWIVAIVGLVLIARSSRRREGSDRRQDERRDVPPEQPTEAPRERTGTR